MKLTTIKNNVFLLLGIGIIDGLVIAAVDNFAFEGEVSPLVIVVLLLIATVAAGWMWQGRGTLTSFGAWACVPLAHVVKQLLGLPDTLHPNTYTSILMLAAFTLGIAAIGTGIGVALSKFSVSSTTAKF